MYMDAESAMFARAGQGANRHVTRSVRMGPKVRDKKARKKRRSRVQRNRQRGDEPPHGRWPAMAYSGPCIRIRCSQQRAAEGEHSESANKQ